MFEHSLTDSLAPGDGAADARLAQMLQAPQVQAACTQTVNSAQHGQNLEDILLLQQVLAKPTDIKPPTTQWKMYTNFKMCWCASVVLSSSNVWSAGRIACGCTAKP